VHTQIHTDHQNRSSSSTCRIHLLCPALNNTSRTTDKSPPPHNRRSTILLLVFTNPSSSMDSNHNRSRNNNNGLSQVHPRAVMAQAHLHPT
jgi:hypothetical protein